MVAMRDPSSTAFAVGRFAGWEPLGFEAGDDNWYRFVANGPTGKADPSGLDRYRLGGRHLGDHSQVCVDLYDDQGNRTGKQYCCGLEADGGSGGSSSSGSSGSTEASTWGTTVSVCAAMAGLWFHPAKILCFVTTLTSAQQANQRVVAVREEDETMLQQLRNDRGSDTVWNGAVSNCHQYALSRLYVGKP